LATLWAIVSMSPPPSRVRAAACSGLTPSSASARAVPGSKQRASSQRAVSASENPASVQACAVAAAPAPRSANCPYRVIVSGLVLAAGS